MSELESAPSTLLPPESTQAIVDDMFATLSDLRLHDQRALAMQTLLGAFLHHNESEGKGSGFCEDEAEAVHRLIFDNKDELGKTVEQLWNTWKKLRPIVRLAEESAARAYQTAARVDRSSPARPFLADNPAYAALLVVCDLLRQPREIRWTVDNSERQSLLKLCQGRIDDMRAADSQPIQ